MQLSKELLPVYQEVIVPLSDVCLPNQFEAELITGKKITSEADALQVMQDFHGKGVKTVILSSTELGDADHLVGLASCKVSNTIIKVRMAILSIFPSKEALTVILSIYILYNISFHPLIYLFILLFYLTILLFYLSIHLFYFPSISSISPSIHSNLPSIYSILSIHLSIINYLACNLYLTTVLYQVKIPKFPAAFVGTGDLFTALTTAWLHRTNGDLKTSLENTLNTMQAS